jgi:RHS repeat-associated protein
MKGRIQLSVALVMLCWTVPSLAAVRAGVTTYRVQLVLYPGDDGAAVAKRLAAMYRGTLETAVDDDGSFSIALSPATADLMGRDPAVQHLELAEATPASMVDTASALETTAVATPWKLGDYQYDGSGNIRRIGADFYAYDNRNRLVLSADASQSTLVPKQSYTYDNFGNMTSIATTGSGLTTMGVNTSSNRVTAVTAAGASTTTGYDQAGNMTRYGTASYTYDALNMLTRSTFDGLTRYYVYSASDERIGTIEVSAAGTRSEWTIRDAAGQVLRRFSKESTGEWKWQEDYIYRGSQMLAAEVPDSTKTRHFHLDHLGTPRLITGNGGVELSRHTYHPFGTEIASTSSTATPHEKKQFTGHERDAESLDYMHARFYAPYMGRFLSVDPLIPKTAMRAPQMWNRYSYVANNPLNRVDPDGKLLQIAGCADTKSETCQKNYNLYLSTFGKQSQDAAKYLQLGKNGTVSFKGISGTAFGAKFGTMGRASNFLISNRAATFSITTDTSRVNPGAGGASTRYGNVGAEIAIDLGAFPTPQGGTKQTATGALAHELGHALGTLLPGIRDAFDAQLGHSVWTQNEGYGTAFENQWRREQGMDQRLFYKYFYGDIGHTRDDVFDWPTP